MEPFRKQYPNNQYSLAFSQPPGTEAMNFTYASIQNSDNAPLKSHYSPHESVVYSPPYAPQDTGARTTWRWKLRNVASNFWFWEFSACLLSLGIAAVICWQLKKLDGKSTFYWDYKWSPTSSLALAVTIAKAAMMVPVASALGQLKWHWYRTFRKLDGLEHFDEASRGVLGSLGLLWRHIASIGAIITVCALGIDALAQNAVRIALIPSHTYESYVFGTRTFNAVSYFSQRGRELPTSDMLSTIYHAISATEPAAFEQRLAYCTTGNCTYGTYNSLAIDFECVHSETERTGPIILHTGLNDHDFYLNITEDIIKSNTTEELPAPRVYSNLGPLISRWLILVNPSVINPAPLAMECAFYWTVKTYSSKVVNGVFYEDVNSTYVNKTNIITSKEDIVITPDECWLANEHIPSNDPNCKNVVSYFSHKSLQAWFALSDFSLTGSGYNDTQMTDDSLYWSYNSIFIQSMMSNLIDANETTIVTQINTIADRLSTTLTTMIRQTPEYLNDSSHTYGITNGTTIWSPLSVYDIQWRYLFFPILIVGCSTLFFIATVVFTWGEGGWKSSQLAVVFHGLSENDAKAAGSVKDYADMRELGHEMHVKLLETESGKKLVSQNTVAHM
ncbi:hypothetical protein BKA66DRAFT_570723 [Pyrenochaeta sp. MPI-SDFR-AT-0127]|nr:hypothetical protein BKA66DRAFT_570723 [Pyrenochaeta sp. MPI-SDFR-AT-0127]